jgi:flagellar basal-body rod protein FlgG
MLRGLYTSSSGMNAELLRQDVVANNIANAGTTGFKKDDAVFESFPDRLLKRIHDRMDASSGPAGMAAFTAQPQAIGVMGQGVRPVDTPTHFTDGSPVMTGRPLDLAMQGNGLFTVQRGDGSLAYTRDGSFTLNSENQLATMSGNLVMAQGDRPLVINGNNIVVDQGGAVTVDGVDAGKLALAAYDPQTFQKLGENLYVKPDVGLSAMGEEAAPDGRLMQGYTEESNVQVVTEMVRMIEVDRAYDSNSKIIQMQDETLGRLINDVGKPSA